MTPDQGAITISLKPTLDNDNGSLAGFTLLLSGEADHEFATPSSLQRPGIGEFMAIRLNASKFTVLRFAIQSSWKCVQRLVNAELLDFYTDRAKPGAGVQSVVPHQETRAALNIRPLSLRLAITKDKDEQPHLSLLMAVGSASGLNSGMQCPDRDDIFALDRIRTSLL